MVSAKPVSVDDVEMINTSFPNFMGLMKDIGANFQS
jgi:5-enolpyruvylshikimate-3-phosphate synthase